MGRRTRQGADIRCKAAAGGGTHRNLAIAHQGERSCSQVCFCSCAVHGLARHVCHCFSSPPNLSLSRARAHVRESLHVRATVCKSMCTCTLFTDASGAIQRHTRVRQVAQNSRVGARAPNARTQGRRCLCRCICRPTARRGVSLCPACCMCVSCVSAPRVWLAWPACWERCVGQRGCVPSHACARSQGRYACAHVDFRAGRVDRDAVHGRHRDANPEPIKHAGDGGSGGGGL